MEEGKHSGGANYEVHFCGIFSSRLQKKYLDLF